MLISGITKFSLIDFPGKVSCIIFTPGCNFRCDFCHNPEFVLPEFLKKNLKSLIFEKAFLAFLEKRKGLLEGVSICGGEPTLQKDLYIFCKKIKDMGFLVKLDTNGRDPEVLQKLLDNNLLDYVAMDMKNPFGKLHEIVGVNESEEEYKKSVKILLNSKIAYEFRTTVIKGIHTEEDIENIAKNIEGAQNYFLQNYRSGNTLKKDFTGKSFQMQELEQLKNISKKYVRNIGIRA
ncbi:anaerobic ribonucleoside-triphosphate reductase activating protein [Candidatus Gracilibacteria bacterium 28_42_T64]|nr:anaerobic ribonucleoside-triphosphate reductase activating protein [Candidatus Gracilibacteria bacterium 28_42_T64]